MQIEKIKYNSKTFPFKEIEEVDMTVFQYNLINTIKQSIFQLQTKEASTIQSQILLKTHEISKKYQFNLDGIHNIYAFKYIVCSIFFMENAERTISSLQTNSSNVKKNKKTNIRIDFDFSKVFEMLTEKQNKIDQMVNADNGLIEKMQKLMLQKQNNISELEGTIEELKAKCQELEKKKNNKERQSKLKFDNLNTQFQVQQREKDKILEEKQKLLGEVQDLQQESQEEVQEFLRRCLFTQAISIQGFLNHLS